MGRWRAVAAAAAVGVLAPIVPMAVTAGPAAPATFPGNNGPIVFVRDDYKPDLTTDLWISSPDGAWVSRLTDDEAWDDDPAISPDGTRIAFESDRNSDPGIYVMNVDGSGITKLRSGGTQPSWSPDGTKIVYHSGGDIWVMASDGTGPVQLTNGAAVDEVPSWSPDGTRIAFGSNRGGVDGIYAMDADGTDPVLITDDVAGDIEFSWAPDGSRLAFACYPDSQEEICTIDPDGSDVTRLTDNDITDIDGFPSWSPDGTKIVFRREATGDAGQLYVIDANGTGEVQITFDTLGDGHPSWGSGTSSATAITGLAPDPPITGLGYTVSGTVTVDPLRADPAADLPGSVQVSDGATSCTTGAGPTGTPGEYAFSCSLTAGPPGAIDVTARYAAPGSDVMPSSATVSTAVIVMPGPPTEVSATVPGPGSQSTVVSWTTPPGPVPTGFQIRCIPLGLPAQTGPPDNPNARWTGGLASPVVVTRLTRGVTYHCKVRARYGPEYTNEIGDRYEGPLSAWTNAFTVPIVAPPAPTGVLASTPVAPYPRTTVVQWSSLPNDTGAPITFTTRCTSWNGGATRTATGGPPAVVVALNRGNTYVCTVTAKNAAGSATSAPSNAVKVPR